MIDRNYDRITIVCYPAGAGGNFLINCLSLTDNCVLRNAQLADQQLAGKMSVTDKLEYLQAQLKHSKQQQIWNDLGLGCENLFGMPSHGYFDRYPEAIQQRFNAIVPKLIEQQKHLFIVAHTAQYLKAYCKFWTNAKIIVMTDYCDFLQARRFPKFKSQMSIKHWDIDEESSSFEWNVQQTFCGNEQQFLEHLQRCANWLGLSVTTTDHQLLDYRKVWLETISQYA